MKRFVKNKIYTFIAPWGVFELNDNSNIRFGFFGEFGYAVISWLPFIKFLKEKGLKIKSVGLKGSSPIWHFSDDHIELDLPVGDSWGSIYDLYHARKKLPLNTKIISPINGRLEGLIVNGYKWENNFLHKFIYTDHYSLLELPMNLPNFIIGAYVVINIKDYFNWGNEDIQNYYKTDEIKSIVEWAYSNNLICVLNRFPAPKEESSGYLKNDPLSDVVKNQHVIDMSKYYENISDLSEKNHIQFGLLSGADHVFATQGGNAALSLILNKNITVLMRGGLDYPDYISLSKKYESSYFEIIYELSQSKFFEKNYI